MTRCEPTCFRSSLAACWALLLGAGRNGARTAIAAAAATATAAAAAHGRLRRICDPSRSSERHYTAGRDTRNTRLARTETEQHVQQLVRDRGISEELTDFLLPLAARCQCGCWQRRRSCHRRDDGRSEPASSSSSSRSGVTSSRLGTDSEDAAALLRTDSRRGCRCSRCSSASWRRTGWSSRGTCPTSCRHSSGLR